MSAAAPDEGKILSRVVAPEEAQFERQLRPRTFDEYVGQEQAVASLRVSVEAAKLRRECVDHVLLYGPPGLGKTTLAGIVAHEMQVGFRPTSGPARKRASGVSPVSEWTRRLYSSSTQACVASLSVASVTSGQFSSIASSRPSTCDQKHSLAWFGL